MLSNWGIPPIQELLENLGPIVAAEDAAGRSFEAIREGAFCNPEGRKEALGTVRNPLRQIALGCWLAQRCQSQLSVEVGFGTGTTASFLLSARRTVAEEFRHVVLDCFGLRGTGELTQEYLAGQFGENFERQYRLSTVGLGRLLEECGTQSTDFILIDGDHRFDGVLADFQIAAELLAIGGFMILDDAAFPAIETLVHFLKSNRPDFEVSWLEIPNTAVLRKISTDNREWCHFLPFEVPDRSHWAYHPSGGSDEADDWAIASPKPS